MSKNDLVKTRIRKAWLVSSKHYPGEAHIYYAENADKAKSRAYQSVDTNPNIKIIDFVAKRASEKDQILPTIASFKNVIDGLSFEEMDIITHAYSVNDIAPELAGNRNWFFGDIDNPALKRIVSIGLMKRLNMNVENNLAYFMLTENGINIALALSPLYKYEPMPHYVLKNEREAAQANQENSQMIGNPSA